MNDIQTIWRGALIALLACIGSARAAPPALGTPQPAAALAQARGGSTETASATLTAGVNGNQAANMLTGSNTVQGGSFSGAAGLPIVIQNTGANVLIQNATVIQLHFK